MVVTGTNEEPPLLDIWVYSSPVSAVSEGSARIKGSDSWRGRRSEVNRKTEEVFAGVSGGDAGERSGRKGERGARAAVVSRTGGGDGLVGEVRYVRIASRIWSRAPERSWK